MLTLILALSVGQAPYTPDNMREGEPIPRPRLFRSDGPLRMSRAGAGSDYAFFEAFPASGAGTSGPCSTTPPTGARGEVLTFTRASSAMCTRTATGGLATTGIANGDLVVLSSNVARVEYDSAGTLGLLVEATRTNSLLRSEEIDNASWTKRVANTVWANDAGSPDGTTTADAVFFAATAADVTGIYQTNCPTGSSTSSVYLKGITPMDGGVAQSGTLDMTIDNGVGTFSCQTCPYNPTTWTRCTKTTTFAATGTMMLGNDSRVATCSLPARPAADVLVWGAQCELGAYATSYIPTTTIAVARAAERAIFTLPVAVSTATGSHAISVTPEWSNANGALGYGITYGANASPIYGLVDVRTYDSTTQVTLATTFTAGSLSRLWSSYAGSTQTLSNSVTSTTGAFDGAMPTTTSMEVGSQGLGANVWNAIYSRICADNDASRCR
mgnify:CR=1 FL=1